MGQRHDERRVAIDLHVHTGRYSRCAEFVDPYQIEEYALRAGLAGVVLTEHDVFWQDEEIEILRKRSRILRFFRGIEVTARGCHLVVIGLTEAALLAKGMSMEEVVEIASAQDAAVILAHPYRDADPSVLPVELADAIEVASTSFTTREAAAARELARTVRKPEVASSDGHALSRIGWAWTEFARMPADEKELARMIRTGSGRPVAPNPFPA